MVAIVTLLSLVLIGDVDTPSMPSCTYETVRSVSSKVGVRAEERIRTCVTDPNIVTLDNQIYIIFRKNGLSKRKLVVQFESSYGKAIPIYFNRYILYIHTSRHDRTVLWRKSFNGILINIKNDYVDHDKYHFMDVYGNPVKK